MSFFYFQELVLLAMGKWHCLVATAGYDIGRYIFSKLVKYQWVDNKGTYGTTYTSASSIYIAHNINP